MKARPIKQNYQKSIELPISIVIENPEGDEQCHIKFLTNDTQLSIKITTNTTINASIRKSRRIKRQTDEAPTIYQTSSECAEYKIEIPPMSATPWINKHSELAKIASQADFITQLEIIKDTAHDFVREISKISCLPTTIREYLSSRTPRVIHGVKLGPLHRALIGRLVVLGLTSVIHKSSGCPLTNSTVESCLVSWGFQQEDEMGADKAAFMRYLSEQLGLRYSCWNTLPDKSYCYEHEIEWLNSLNC